MRLIVSKRWRARERQRKGERVASDSCTCYGGGRVGCAAGLCSWLKAKAAFIVQKYEKHNVW